jgi:hypothetical protein
MQSEVMDCFTAFAMTATFAMTGLFMARRARDGIVIARRASGGIVIARSVSDVAIHGP